MESNNEMLKKLIIIKAPKIISHFGWTNIIFSNCNLSDQSLFYLVFHMVNKSLPWDYEFRFVIEEISNINDKAQVGNSYYLH